MGLLQCGDRHLQRGRAETLLAGTDRRAAYGWTPVCQFVHAADDLYGHVDFAPGARNLATIQSDKMQIAMVRSGCASVHRFMAILIRGSALTWAIHILPVADNLLRTQPHEVPRLSMEFLGLHQQSNPPMAARTHG